MSNNYHALFQKSSRSIPLVLVVDDDRDNLLFIGYVLEALNIKYVVAMSGKNTLDLAMDKQPDLILLDIVMPEMNGMETTRLLKQNPFTKNIPVVAVTGLTLPEHRAAIKSAGCEDYICKPFIIDDLEAKLARFLNLSLV
jgi:CheY-like chemotaxis protein